MKFSEEEIRRKIENILSSREFSRSEDGRSILDVIADYVRQVFTWFKERMEALQLPDENLNIPQAGMSPGAVLLLKVIGIILLAAVIFILLFFVFRNLRFSKRVKEREDALLISELKDVNAVEEKALHFYRQGDYRQGLRYLYISLILKLNAWDVIKIDKSKTNRQYMNEVKYSGYSRYDEILGFTHAFNLYWYGKKHIDSGVFDLWYDRYSSLVKGEKA